MSPESMPAEPSRHHPVPLILEEYFADETRAWGVFEDRFGTPRAQFEVDTKGVWDGETLTLKEHFVYSTGRTDDRTWTIRRLGGGCYRGEADDVIGAAMGASDGNAFVWRYVMDLPFAGRSVRVRLSDQLLLQSNDVLIHRARVSKLGVELGRLSMFFVKKRAFQCDPTNPAGR